MGGLGVGGVGFGGVGEFGEFGVDGGGFGVGELESEGWESVEVGLEWEG